MELHKDKVAYYSTFGLGPYFQNDFVSIKKKCDLFSMSFDESLNKIAQKGQMNILVRYWDCEMARTRYLTSCFLDMPSVFITFYFVL